MQKYALVFLGAGFGALARFALLYTHQDCVQWVLILICNILGAYLIGLASSVKNQNLKAFLCAGFCGGFTTFSSVIFIAYIGLIFCDIQVLALNLLLNFSLTIIAVRLGKRTCKIFRNGALNG